MIRQRLLENNTLDLQSAYDQAYSLDLAQRNAEAYAPLATHTTAVVSSQAPLSPHSSLLGSSQIPEEDPVTSGKNTSLPDVSEKSAVAATYAARRKCFFCGGLCHPRSTCPAREATCNKCLKKGHFAPVCKSSKPLSGSVATVFSSHVLATMTNVPNGPSHAATAVTIRGQKVSALMDSCSTDSYISEKVAQKLHLQVYPSSKGITMAQKSLNTSSPGYVSADIVLDLNNQSYPATHLCVLRYLCADVILGQDFQRQHLSVKFEFGGPKAGLTLNGNDRYCAVTAAALEEPSLFHSMSHNCRPVASKSRRFSKDDQIFTEEEVHKLLMEGIIEPSLSPWRAQVVVVKDPTNRHKKRMCVDYSQTVN